MQFPDNYPNEEVLIELLSDSLPDIALRRMTKFADNKVRSYIKIQDGKTPDGKDFGCLMIGEGIKC